MAMIRSGLRDPRRDVDRVRRFPWTLSSRRRGIASALLLAGSLAMPIREVDPQETAPQAVQPAPPENTEPLTPPASETAPPNAPPAPEAAPPSAPPASAPAESPQPAAPPAPANFETVPGDQLRNVLGKQVSGAAGEDMGVVVDVLFDQDKQPRAAVIDFGGFLGVGTRKIAVDWRLLQFMPPDAKMPLKLDLGRATVQAGPVYKEGAKTVSIIGQPSQAAPDQSASSPPPSSALPPAPPEQSPSPAPGGQSSTPGPTEPSPAPTEPPSPAPAGQ